MKTDLVIIFHPRHIFLFFLFIHRHRHRHRHRHHDHHDHDRHDHDHDHLCSEYLNHGAYLGPTGPRWAPCWPHELCYLDRPAWGWCQHQKKTTGILDNLTNFICYLSHKVLWIVNNWGVNSKCIRDPAEQLTNNLNRQNLNALRPRKDGRHFPDDISNWIFLNENLWISIKILLKSVPGGLN